MGEVDFAMFLSDDGSRYESGDFFTSKAGDNVLLSLLLIECIEEKSGGRGEFTNE